jgi:hypothetical protein
MTLSLSHSFLTLQLLSAAEDLQTKLFEAIEKEDLPAVRAFLKQKPELAREKNSRGISPLVMAAYIKDTEGPTEEMTGAPAFFQPPATNQVLREIMRLAPPANVYEACLVGDLKRARSFLEKNPGAIRESGKPWTLLHAAAYSGNVELVKLLLSRGAPIDEEARTNYRNTPLQTAMLTKQAAAARVLVEAGADVNHPQWEGGRVLHDAVWQGNVELVRFFLSHGANANVQVRRGETPLHEAARQGSVELVRLLLSHGANVNVRTTWGETPAISARKYGHLELAAMLEKLAAAEPGTSDSKLAN